MGSGVRHTRFKSQYQLLGGLKQRDLTLLDLRFLSYKTGVVPVLPAPKFNEIKPVNYLESARNLIDVSFYYYCYCYLFSILLDGSSGPVVWGKASMAHETPILGDTHHVFSLTGFISFLL